MSDLELQLFCLPYSGGKAQVFNEILSLVSPGIEVFTIEYAGRGTRAKEPFFEEYNSFFYDVVYQISSKRNKRVPYALFGYSIDCL